MHTLCSINKYDFETFLLNHVSCTIFQNIFAISDLGGFLNRPLESSFKKLHFGGKKCSRGMYEGGMKPRSST